MVLPHFLMPDTSYLSWPFFDDRHRAFARDLDAWATRTLDGTAHPEWREDVDMRCRSLVRRLGEAGWLVHTTGDVREALWLDVRTLCLARETLARHDGLADFAFAMQGLGAGPITLFGSDALRAHWLPLVRMGEAIAAFALSEADAGSDVTAMRTSARRDASGDWIIDGEKTWISNAGIADLYVVFARTPALGDKAFGAFAVGADAPGLSVTRRIDVTAPHPLGTVTFRGCRVPADAMIGAPG